jgi:hypothetical protein
MEEPLTAIQPRQGFATTIEFGEFHFVGSGVRVMTEGPCVVVRCAVSGVRRRAMVTWCTLHHLNSMDDVLQFLLMVIAVGHRCFQCLDAHLERLQRLQLQFNGIQAAHDGIKRSLHDIPQLVADYELMALAEEAEPLDTKLSSVDDWGRLVGMECLN